MADLTLPSDAFRLGSLIVVPSLNRIVRDGHTTDVEPRLMAVLAALAETPGEVVTREALLDSVWADAVVNDEALTRAVSELRKVLGDDARGAVETIRGRGYRLTIPVERIGMPEASAAPAGPPPLAQVSEAGPPRGRSLVLLAVALGVMSLAMSVWAVTRTSRAAQEAESPTDEAVLNEPFRLDSTSRYYRPGLSERGVYYDDSTGRAFWFPDSTESR